MSAEKTIDHPFPVGTRVIERAYPNSPAGVVTGHAPDGWTFVRWSGVRVLSHAPHDLLAAPEDAS